jgi:hypothetical protein
MPHSQLRGKHEAINRQDCRNRDSTLEYLCQDGESDPLSMPWVLSDKQHPTLRQPSSFTGAFLIYCTLGEEARNLKVAHLEKKASISMYYTVGETPSI